MRVTLLALAAATCIATALPAAAQTFEVGPGGIGVDVRGPRARDRDWDRDDYRRVERRRARSWDETGSVGRCREVTIRERDEVGYRVTRSRRDCR